MTASTPLFDPAVLSACCAHIAVPPGYVLRPLAADDYGRGHSEVLGTLSSVDGLSSEVWGEVFAEMQGGGGVFVVVVAEEGADGRVVASGTLVVERKFLHGGQKAGHIEDIVVHGDAQGCGLGRVIIEALKAVALGPAECYKAILDCADGVRPFYEKLGFEHKGNFMALYRDH